MRRLIFIVIALSSLTFSGCSGVDSIITTSAETHTADILHDTTTDDDIHAVGAPDPSPDTHRHISEETNARPGTGWESRDSAECEEDAQKNTACGLNGNGIQTAVCTDGQWGEFGSCVDSDECTNETQKDDVCGMNDNGTKTATCVDGQWSPFDDCVDPDVCTNGTQTLEDCGMNNNGTKTATCKDGQWAAFTSCVNSSVCVNATQKTKTCGLNAQGEKTALCIDGQWGPYTDCVDPDVCTNGTQKNDACGMNGTGTKTSFCKNGQWNVSTGCVDSDVCINNTEKSQPCGLNANGTKTEICKNGQWKAFTYCLDPDVCTNNTEKTKTCGLNGNGTQTAHCTNGQWSAFANCVDLDVCTNNDQKTQACGFNGKGTQITACQNGQWDAFADCVDPDECTNNTQKTLACGINGSGIQTATCMDGQWGEFAACIDTDICPNNTQKTQACGVNGKGVKTALCTQGQWSAFTDCIVLPTWANDFNANAAYNRDEVRCVSNVVDKFKKMVRHVEPLAINARKEMVPKPTSSHHWQGMSRHPDYKQVYNPDYEYFFLSKSGNASNQGGLYQFKVKPYWEKTHYPHQVTRTNLWDKKEHFGDTEPHETSHFFNSSHDFHIRARSDKNLYCTQSGAEDCDYCDHWSGFAQTHSRLFAPVTHCYNNAGSAMSKGIISIFDVSYPTNHKPKLIKTHYTDAGATVQALGVIPDGQHNGVNRYLVITVEQQFDYVRLWHFDANGTLLAQSQPWNTTSMSTFGYNGGAKGVNNISLVRECGTNDVYAVGSQRSHPSDPTADGKANMVGVWKVHEPKFDADGNINDPAWKGLDEHVDGGNTLWREYWCRNQNTDDDKFCDFGKAGNVYVSAAGYPVLYASESHESHDDVADSYDFGVRIGEFPYRAITHEEAYITLFYKSNFAEDSFNASATFTATQYFRDKEDYEKLSYYNPKSGKGDINNKASSAIVYLPAGCKVTIWEDSDPPEGDSITYSQSGLTIDSSFPSHIDNKVSAVTFSPSASKCGVQGN